MSTQHLPPGNSAPVPYDPTSPQALALQKFTRRPFMWLHLPSTLQLISRCLRDSRTPTTNKILFLGAIGFLLALVLVPEFGVDVAALAFPVGGEVFDLVGIPFEGAFDWTFVILVLPLLLNLFPAEVRAAHVRALQGLPPPALPAGQGRSGS